jgi:hypothetical protein
MFALPAFAMILGHLLFRHLQSRESNKNRPVRIRMFKVFSCLFFAATVIAYLTIQFPFYHAFLIDNMLLFFSSLLPVVLIVTVTTKNINQWLYRLFVWYTLVSPLIMFSWFVLFYRTLDDCELVEKDPRVTALFSNCNEEHRKLLASFTGNTSDYVEFATRNPRAVFPSSNTDFIYLTSGEEQSVTERDRQAFIKVSRKMGKPVWAELGTTILRGMCRSDALCYLLYSDMLRIETLDENTMERKLSIDMLAIWPSRDVEFKPQTPRFPVYIKERNQLLISTSEPPGLLSFNSENLELEGTLYNYESAMLDNSIHFALNTFTENKKNKALYFTRECYFCKTPIYRLTYDLKITMSYSLPLYYILKSWSFLLWLDIDPELNEIYATSTMDGAIYIFNELTGEFKESIPLKLGLRLSSYDPRTKRLFVGNYVDGYLYIVDMKNRRLLEKIFIGRKSHQIYYDPQTDHVLTTSANGWFEIDVSRIKP